MTSLPASHLPQEACKLIRRFCVYSPCRQGLIAACRGSLLPARPLHPRPMAPSQPLASRS